MFRRTRYQQGSVQREKRRSGPDVWVYRWYEVGSDGARESIARPSSEPYLTLTNPGRSPQGSTCVAH